MGRKRCRKGMRQMGETNVEHLRANAKVATVPDPIPASSDTAKSDDGQQMTQCCIKYTKKAS